MGVDAFLQGVEDSVGIPVNGVEDSGINIGSQAISRGDFVEKIGNWSGEAVISAGTSYVNGMASLIEGNHRLVLAAYYRHNNNYGADDYNKLYDVSGPDEAMAVGSMTDLGTMHIDRDCRGDIMVSDGEECLITKSYYSSYTRYITLYKYKVNSGTVERATVFSAHTCSISISLMLFDMNSWLEFRCNGGRSFKVLLSDGSSLDITSISENVYGAFAAKESDNRIVLWVPNSSVSSAMKKRFVLTKSGSAWGIDAGTNETALSEHQNHNCIGFLGGFCYIDKNNNKVEIWRLENSVPVLKDSVDVEGDLSACFLGEIPTCTRVFDGDNTYISIGVSTGLMVIKVTPSGYSVNYYGDSSKGVLAGGYFDGTHGGAFSVGKFSAIAAGYRKAIGSVTGVAVTDARTGELTKCIIKG